MQIVYDDAIAGRNVIFESILDEVIGGASLNVARLDTTKKYVKAGAPVYYVPATRVMELCKTVAVIDGGSTSAPRVGKTHFFKVGDVIGDGTTAQVILSIDTTSDDYDVLTLGSTIATAATAGTKLFQGTVSGSSAVLAYTPNGVLKNDVYIGDGNADGGIVTIGNVRESALAYPMPTLFKVALRGGTSGTGTSLITFTT
jgi:hypothetical protein